MDWELLRALARKWGNWQRVNWEGIIFGGYPPEHCVALSKCYVHDPHCPDCIIGEVSVGIFNPTHVQGCFAVQVEDCWSGPWDGFIDFSYFKSEKEVNKAIGEDGFINEDLDCKYWPNLEKNPSQRGGWLGFFEELAIWQVVSSSFFS